MSGTHPSSDLRSGIDWHQKLLDAHPDDIGRIADRMADEIDQLRLVVYAARHLDDILSEAPQKLSDALAAYDKATAPGAPAPRFANVSCSQCGRGFGPGNHGFSHCANHHGMRPHD